MVIKVVLNPAYNNRYVIMKVDTNSILDDAQGYGFSSYEKALKYAKVKFQNNENVEIIDESPVSGSLF